MVARLGKGSEVVLACATKSVTRQDGVGGSRELDSQHNKVVLTLPASEAMLVKKRQVDDTVTLKYI